MGLAFIEPSYIFPDQEQGKLPLLQFIGNSNPVGFSGQTAEIQITPREIILPPDSLFLKGPLTRADYDKGYEPVTLDPVDIHAAVSAINFREIDIDNRHLPITPEGNIRIPVELLPIKDCFEQAAGIITGISGPLKENWVMVLALTREILRLPDRANNSFPHCDHMRSNTDDGIGMKTEAADLLPQIFVTGASFVGTRFYPTLALTDIAQFKEGGGAAGTLDARAGKISKGTRVIDAPTNHFILSSDVHVHAGPPVRLSNVPKSERFPFVEYNNNGNPSRTGSAVFRELFHLSLERR